MTINEIKSRLPEAAKDTKLNLGSLFSQYTNSGLSAAQFFGTAYAIAVTLNNPALVEAIETEAAENFTPEVKLASQAAANLMAMNNVYYRFVHLASDKEFAKLPAGLRMNFMANPGVPKADFELYSLAVSALNGCGMCIDSHVEELKKHDVSRASIQASIKIAAVLNAAHQGLSMG